MSLKEFDTLEEKIARMVTALKQAREENAVLKKELADIKSNSELKDQERSEIKKKVTSLLELVDSIEA